MLLLIVKIPVDIITMLFAKFAVTVTVFPVGRQHHAMMFEKRHGPIS
jgi:hypothetical protein